MQDRIPTKPNRYAVYDDAHNFVRYEYHERADEPTQTGSAVNKDNFLPDDLCMLLEIPTTSEVKDALAVIDDIKSLANTKAKIETGSYTGTGTFGKGAPSSITSSFTPKVILISANHFGANGRLMLIYGNTVTSCEGTVSSAPTLSVDGWGTQTISWYNTQSGDNQLNANDMVYRFTVIG